MAKENAVNPWRPLLQYVVEKMDVQITDDRVDRALKTAAGGLSRNPPYVVDQFAVETGGVAEAGAISPKGIIAVVFAEYTGSEGKATRKFLRLLTRWPDGRREMRELGANWASTSVRIFFSEGSDDPAVLVGSTLLWGTLVQSMDNLDPSLVGESFVLQDSRGPGDRPRFVTWIGSDGRVRSEPSSETWVESTRWIGRLGGTTARITMEDGQATLRWRNHALLMDGIRTETIGFVPGRWAEPNKDGWVHDHLTFVAGKTAYRWFGETPEQAQIPDGMLHAVDGRIFVSAKQGAQGTVLLEFRGTEFVPVAWTVNSRGYEFYRSTSLQIHRTGYVLTLRNAARQGLQSVSVWLSEPNADPLAFAREHYGIRAFHGRICVVEEGDRCSFDGELARPFPLYGTPFDRLAEVTDARGECAMSWAFADGTFHVLRFPLP